MAKNKLKFDKELLGILENVRNDAEYIPRLETKLKTAKKVLKSCKYRLSDCPECQIVYMPHDKRQIFCSRKCASKARLKRFRAK